MCYKDMRNSLKQKLFITMFTVIPGILGYITFAISFPVVLLNVLLHPITKAIMIGFFTGGSYMLYAYFQEKRKERELQKEQKIQEQISEQNRQLKKVTKYVKMLDKFDDMNDDEFDNIIKGMDDISKGMDYFHGEIRTLKAILKHNNITTVSKTELLKQFTHKELLALGLNIKDNVDIYTLNL